MKRQKDLLMNKDIERRTSRGRGCYEYISTIWLTTFGIGYPLSKTTLSSESLSETVEQERVQQVFRLDTPTLECSSLSRL